MMIDPWSNHVSSISTTSPQIWWIVSSVSSDLLTCHKWVPTPKICWFMSSEKKTMTYQLFFSHCILRFDRANQNMKTFLRFFFLDGRPKICPPWRETKIKMERPGTAGSSPCQTRKGTSIFLSPPVQVARWAPMRRFPSVCDKNSYYIMNHSWKGIVGSQMKIGHNVLDVWGNKWKILTAL